MTVTKYTFKHVGLIEITMRGKDDEELCEQAYAKCAMLHDLDEYDLDLQNVDEEELEDERLAGCW